MKQGVALDCLLNSTGKGCIREKNAGGFFEEGEVRSGRGRVM